MFNQQAISLNMPSVVFKFDWTQKVLDNRPCTSFYLQIVNKWKAFPLIPLQLEPFLFKKIVRILAQLNGCIYICSQITAK